MTVPADLQWGRSPREWSGSAHRRGRRPAELEPRRQGLCRTPSEMGAEPGRGHVLRRTQGRSGCGGGPGGRRGPWAGGQVSLHIRGKSASLADVEFLPRVGVAVVRGRAEGTPQLPGAARTTRLETTDAHPVPRQETTGARAEVSPGHAPSRGSQHSVAPGRVAPTSASACAWPSLCALRCLCLRSVSVLPS